MLRRLTESVEKFRPSISGRAFTLAPFLSLPNRPAKTSEKSAHSVRNNTFLFLFFHVNFRSLPPSSSSSCPSSSFASSPISVNVERRSVAQEEEYKRFLPFLGVFSHVKELVVRSSRNANHNFAYDCRTRTKIELR